MRVSGRRHWMVLRDGTLPTAWLSSRKNSVLRCIERLCAETASEHRRTQRRLQEVEEAMATQNQPGSILPGRTMQTAVPVSGGSLRLRLLKQSCCAGNWRRPMRRSAGMRPACSPTSVPCWTCAGRTPSYRRCVSRPGRARPCRSRRPSPPFRCWKAGAPGHPFPAPRGCRGGSGTASRRDRDPAGHGHPGVGAQDQAGSPLGGHHLPAGTADGDLTKSKRPMHCRETSASVFLMLILPRWCGAP